MNTKILVAAALVAFPFGSASAQFTTYTNRVTFEAAAGAIQTQTFNSATPTILASGSGSFSQPYGNITLTGNANGDYFAIAAGSNPGNIDATNFFYWSERDPNSGQYTGNGGVGPTFSFNFTTPATAFGFDWKDTDPTDSYDFAIGSTHFTTPPFSLSSTGSGFFGVIATTAFSQATFVQTAAGGTVDPFGIDNVTFSEQPGAPEPNAVPEPASIILMATGLLGVIGAARRKRTA